MGRSGKIGISSGHELFLGQVVSLCPDNALFIPHLASISVCDGSMAVNMSLVFLVSRFSAYILLLTIHMLLVSLYILSLNAHTGGAVEVLCLVLDLLAVLFIVAHVCDLFRNREVQPAYRCSFVFPGAMLFLSSLACIAITARAARRSGLVSDFYGFLHSSSAVSSVVALSWLAVLLSALLIAIVYQERRLVVAEVSPYTEQPGRHRVVFRQGMKPLKIIDILQDPGRDRASGQYPRIPERIHLGFVEQPARMQTTYNHWPGETA